MSPSWGSFKEAHMRKQPRRAALAAAMLVPCLAVSLASASAAFADPAAAGSVFHAEVVSCNTQFSTQLDQGALVACLNKANSRLEASLLTVVPSAPTAEPDRQDAPAVEVDAGAEVLAVPEPAAAGSGGYAGGVWADLRWCESTNDYGANTGNGYYGAYQFSLETWRWIGYSGYPHLAEPAVQDEAAMYLQSIMGWSPWPHCSWLLGLA